MQETDIISLTTKATIHCSNILKHNLELTPSQKLIIIHEKNQGIILNNILTDAYTNALNNIKHNNFELIEFNLDKADDLKDKLFNLNKNDVAILIQNTNFRISNYRIRLDLKNRECFVIEHTLISLEKNEARYIKSLTYDKPHWDNIKNNILPKLKEANNITIISNDNNKLTYTGPFEEAKLNIGDLKANLGSFYPIGEIFTEPTLLENVTGTASIYAVPDNRYQTYITTPFQIEIKNGRVISHNGPKEFEQLFQLVKTENESKEVWIREMGFGLNRFIGKDKPLTYVSAHERQEGFHISLGLKHGVFRKKLHKKINQRFHIDMFVDLKEILIDNITIYQDGKYLID